VAVEDVRRRASYGPTSPAIGERGARTRATIIDSALNCFAARGFQNTLVEHIAAEAGVSRAGIYQYFESKEDVFLELVRESGAELVRMVRRLRPLSETAEGFENLHWWLGDWAWVYDRYATVFVQWSNVDSPKSPLRPMIAQFIESFVTNISPRLAEANAAEGLDPESVAVLILALLIRFNYFRNTGIDRGLTDDDLIGGLTVFLQVALFPHTPAEAIDLDRVSTGQFAERRGGPGRAARTGQRTVAQARLTPRSARAGERAQRTTRKLLDAGAVVFGDHGYHRPSVEDILAEAGVGRGTFYKYFGDKLELLTMLGKECADRLDELVERFEEAATAPDSLRAWIFEFVQIHRRYGGVLRVWTAGEPRDETIAGIGEQIVMKILATFDAVLTKINAPLAPQPRAGALVLLSLLERFPDYADRTRYSVEAEDIVEVLATLVERALLGRGSTAQVDPVSSNQGLTLHSKNVQP
jgi:AcrR family transcriptional regulator